MGRHANASRSGVTPHNGSGGQPRSVSPGPFAQTKVRIGLALALVVLLVAGIYYLWRQNQDSCGEIREVSVITDGDIDGYVRQLAERAEESTCLDLSVEAVPASHTTERLTDRDSPHVWIAESQARIRQVRTTLGQEWSDIGPSLGVSPVVVAGRGLPELPSWTKTLTARGLRTESPGTSDVSNAAVIGALSEMSSGSLTHKDLIEVLTKRALAMNDGGAPPDLARMAAADARSIALTTERSYATFSHDHPDSGIEATVPSSGTVNLDYRVTNVAQRPDRKLAGEAIRALAEVLHTDAGKQIRSAEGIRAPDGTPLPDGAGVARVTMLDPPDRGLVDNVLRKWTALTQPIRALIVQDVSGSMTTRDAGGRSRADLLRDAALLGLKKLPKNSALGYWEFSIDRGGQGQDYRELMPIRPLSAEHDGTDMRTALGDAVRRSLGDLHGGTGLYDTALAAYRKVYESYDPAYSNSVILMTDGRNEDPDSISLQHLISELNIMKNPIRPIPIVTIGISDDADTQALKKISDASGGSSFVAHDPKDIARILLQAVAYRAGGV